MIIEAPGAPPPRLREILADFGGVYAVNGLIGFIFAVTGPVAIILAVATGGGLSESDIASWIFGAYFINGVLSVLLSRWYRMPLVLLWTIPGAVLVGPALGHLSFAEVIGAYVVTGLLIAVVGASGWVRRFMQIMPMPIVMGMVAGVFLKFGLNIVFAIRDDFWIAAPMTVAYLLLGALPRLARLMPPLIGAMIIGAIAIAWLGSFHPSGSGSLGWAHPNLYLPAFSWQAMLELVVPLAITVLVVQNGQGIAILNATGHPPPVNALTIACGAVSVLTALVGSVSTCITGPTNAMISASGEPRRHYTAGIFVGLLAMVFGLLSPVFARLLLATPAAFIATVGGLAMLRVLQTAFTVAFKDRFALGALVTFLVTVADVGIFNIGAPFWALVFGFAASWTLEREDFRAREPQ